MFYANVATANMHIKMQVHARRFVKCRIDISHRIIFSSKIDTCNESLCFVLLNYYYYYYKLFPLINYFIIYCKLL